MLLLWLGSCSFTKRSFSNIKIIKNNNKIDGKRHTFPLNKYAINLNSHKIFQDLINSEIDKNQGRIRFQTFRKQLRRITQ